MWRFVILAALGLVIGTKARSERQIVLTSFLFGFLYGGAEVLTIAAVRGPLPSTQILLLFGLGLIMAAPVYATAEIWRRTRTRAIDWLRRLIR
jgi:hypothetical protein